MPIYRFIDAQLFGINPENVKVNRIPEVTIPISFDVMSPEMVLEEIKTARDSEMSAEIVKSVELKYCKLVFGENSKESRNIIDEINLNPTLGMTVDEIEKKPTTVPTILSVGTFKWLPNVEAVKYLVTKVWPLIKKQLPNAVLKIVGNAPTEDVYQYEKQDSSIQVIGRIPDIRDAFATSDILMAPVFSGKGTRYKVLEAMASGTPIVATTTAVEGLEVVNGTHVMTSNTPEGMAGLAIELLNNEEKRKKMAVNGKKFVKDQYDWSLISHKLDAIYQRIGSK